MTIKREEREREREEKDQTGMLCSIPAIFPGIFLSRKIDMIVIAGGVMPAEDAAALKHMGVKEVMLQDTPPQAIVETLKRLVAERGQR